LAPQASKGDIANQQRQFAIWPAKIFAKSRKPTLAAFVLNIDPDGNLTGSSPHYPYLVGGNATNLVGHRHSTLLL
jgi:hypothetical protein